MISNQVRTNWAIEQWHKLPAETRKDLTPCLQAAGEGFLVVQAKWREFLATRPGIRNWEAAALADVVRQLTKHATAETLNDLLNSV